MATWKGRTSRGLLRGFAPHDAAACPCGQWKENPWQENQAVGHFDVALSHVVHHSTLAHRWTEWASVAVTTGSSGHSAWHPETRIDDATPKATSGSCLGPPAIHTSSRIIQDHGVEYPQAHDVPIEDCHFPRRAVLVRTMASDDKSTYAWRFGQSASSQCAHPPDHTRVRAKAEEFSRRCRARRKWHSGSR